MSIPITIIAMPNNASPKVNSLNLGYGLSIASFIDRCTINRMYSPNITNANDII